MSEEDVFDDYLRFLDSDFSAALLTMRKRLGYTQKEMAERIGVFTGIGRREGRLWGGGVGGR